MKSGIEGRTMKVKTILRADEMGFCLGVRRAVGALEEAVARKNSQVYTLGPIIHNPGVVQDFAQKGVQSISCPQKAPAGSYVVLRAHGVPPSVREDLERRGCLVVDGTCPKVLASHKRVSRYAAMHYNTIIVGDPDHGEIQGLAGCAACPVVVSNALEAEALNLEGPVMVIAQTTIKQEEYDQVCAVLKKACEARGTELVVVNSICSATSRRQQALKELCSKVEACLIIGGRESANTQRLYMTARATGIPCWHIQDALDIPPEIAAYDIIGLSAGASTPDSIISEVEACLRSM